MKTFIIRFLSLAGLAAILAACGDDTKVVEVEVPVPVPGETEVVTVEVPGETIIVPGETEIVEVEVPGETVVVEVPGEIPPCGPTQPLGACEAGETCFDGACVDSASLCSPTNPEGTCAAGLTCFTGGCVLTSGLCGAEHPDGPCEVGSLCLEGACIATGNLCSSNNLEGLCPTGQECTLGICAEPEVDPCTVHVYTEQPELGVATERITPELLALVTVHLGETPLPALQTITVDGLEFRDMNRNGALDMYEDWRLHETCRTWDLIEQMKVAEVAACQGAPCLRIGLMSEGSRTGNGTADGSLPTSTVSNIVTLYRRYSLVRLGSRSAFELAQYHNNVQALAEYQPLAIPVTITADPVHGFGLSTHGTTGVRSVGASAVVSPWPYPLGLGAINDLQLTSRFGEVVREEFRAMGIRWQLGPMADLGTEPRWARVQNVFGENAFHVAPHVRATIEAFQAADIGGLRFGIAATMKHFPGAGPDEDGMDSHSYAGRYNVFPGNHFTYHLIPFQAAVDAGVAAVMPCYSIFEGQMEYNPEQVAAGFSYGLMTELLREEMGFDGMATGDWGTLGNAYNQESMSAAQRAAMWLTAGSDQFGSDSESNFMDAYNLGYIGDAEIDRSVFRILEMTFKLGLFENPYVDAAAATEVVRSEANLVDGFNAQKRAIIVLSNSGNATSRPLPILGSRAGLDRDLDGTIQVYFDGVGQSLAGDDYLTDILGGFSYTAPAAEGVLAIAEAPSITEADIAIIRITARKGVYFGMDAGVPLSFDGLFPGQSNDSTRGPAVQDRNRVINALRVRDGYTRYAPVLDEFGEPVLDEFGEPVFDTIEEPATNPTLSIVIVMHFDRPGIVRPWVTGVELDELPNQPGSYHSVSDEANIGGEGRNPVNALLVDFGALDRAVLDVVFYAHPIEGFPYSRARLPMEIPSSDAAVEGQFEDLPADSLAPTYRLGAGSNLNLP